MTDEVDEMSAASRGSHAAAWAVEHGGSIVYVAIRAHDAQEWAGSGPVDVVPLYRSPALTDSERFVLREVRDIYADEDDVKCNEIAAVIDGLLERLK
jgi:hypothetical protein